MLIDLRCDGHHHHDATTLIVLSLFASLILTMVYSASRNNPAYLFNLLDEADANARANILVLLDNFSANYPWIHL